MKIRKMLAAAAAVASLGAPAQAQTAACSLALMASLDMTNLPEGRAAVPLSINGTSYQFMVDTAGVFSKISQDVVNQQNLKETPTNMELYGVGGKLRLSSVNIQSLKIGNNEAKNFHLAVGGFSPPTGSKFDGVIGADLLTLFDVEFDFANRKMNLFSQDHCPGKVVYWTRSGYAEVPFHLTSGPLGGNNHIALSMTLDGHDVTTDLDTGSSFTWLNRQSASRIFSVDEKAPGVERVPGSSDDSPVYTKRFNLLQIGGVSVQNPQIEIIFDRSGEAFRMQHSEKSRDDPIYGARLEEEELTLGMNVLSKLHFFIAYKEHKIYATAADAH
jgi:predicted aspartyl protease